MHKSYVWRLSSEKRPVSLIRDTLIQIRTELGFETAKAFYRHLEARGALEFNYAHYMKIEGGKALPSPAMISAIGAALDPSRSDRLTLAYCATVFQGKRHLFKIPAPEATPAKPASTPASPTSREPGDGATLIRQQYLTEAQVAALCRSSVHYSLFLVLTLARGAVAPDRLATLLERPLPEIRDTLSELAKARLVRQEHGEVSSTAKEMRFPQAETDTLRKSYEQIDLWNFDFDKRFGFEGLMQKMMIRRVSARYLGVILAHSNVLLDLIRAAEEINPDYNDDVLMLNFTLSRGKLPG